MLIISYKIYSVGGEKEFSGFGYSAPRTLIDYNSMVCDSREQFKKIMRETYNGNIKFARSKKMIDGDLYCIITRNTEYESEFIKISVLKVNCDNCSNEIVIAETDKYKDKLLNVKHYDLQLDNKYNYCSKECFINHHDELKNVVLEKNDGINPNEFIYRTSYYDESDGYIYKITKKSSGEFYIGQTNAIPVFRWAQHLKSSRFPIKNICDYQFEVLEIVSDIKLIFEKESESIKNHVKLYPNLILNKSGIKKEEIK